MKRYSWTLRSSEVKEADSPKFYGPDETGRWLSKRAESRKPVEHFGIVLLDARNVVVGTHVISKGTLNGALVHPRDLFVVAIKGHAAGIILYHNHPSGDPTPSKEDIALTERMIKAGKIIGIEVLDHIITTPGCAFVSFKERGLI